jgi:hypothetical protein
MSGNERTEGRELDALIAEKVMGWKVHTLRWEPCSSGGLWECECGASYCSPPWGRDKIMRDESARWCYDNRGTFVPRYSTDIAAAWLVVEAMAARLEEADESGIAWPWSNSSYCALQQRGVQAGWAASFCVIDNDEWYENPENFGGARADTAPLAICLASLNALADPTRSLGVSQTDA